MTDTAARDEAEHEAARDTVRQLRLEITEAESGDAPPSAHRCAHPQRVAR